uniref:Rab3 GTPase-activating protein catalytic subunit n=1 Tax=Mycena chlorophos TaxID=658473 RepID=A0ABQ0M3W0_MYCCL|nr:predicted protein [Mycena chlorophos]
MAQQTLSYPHGLSVDSGVANSEIVTLDQARVHGPPYPNEATAALVPSLLNAEDATSLVVSVLHAILDWLSRLQRGSLRLPGPTDIATVLRPPFILDFSVVDAYAAEEPILPPAPPVLDELLANWHSSLSAKVQDDIISTMEYKEQGNRVLQQLDALGSDILARGIVQDTDPEVPEESTQSSTATMSELVANIEITNDLLGSPVADLFSFWDAMVQAFVLHPKDDVIQDDVDQPEVSASDGESFHWEKRQLRAAIISDSPARKESAWRIVRGLEPMARKHRSTYGAFLCSGAPLLLRWDRSLVQLTRRYLLSLQVVQGHPSLVAQLFLAIAYRGVADFVELVKEWTEDVMY